MQVKIIRDDIPLGYTHDEHGNMLSYKSSDGYWSECTRDEHGNELTYKASDGHWSECTYDVHGNERTYRNGDGWWREYTRDEHGNVLSYKDSDGLWSEYTRDVHGNELTYRSDDGYWSEYTRDVHGNVLSYKSSDGVWSEYTRDGNGNELTYKDSDGRWRESPPFFLKTRSAFNRWGKTMKFLNYISGVIRVFFTPSCWIQFNGYKSSCDQILIAALKNPNFEAFTSYYVRLNGSLYWIANHPYASFICEEIIGRPSRITILRAMDAYEDWIVNKKITDHKNR